MKFNGSCPAVATYTAGGLQAVFDDWRRRKLHPDQLVIEAREVKGAAAMKRRSGDVNDLGKLITVLA